MERTDRQPGRGGRLQDRSRDVALREAVISLLRDVGYDGLTMDAVAAHAGSGKNTIYRRWRGKAEMVIDALHSAKGPSEFPDHGSLRADLRAVVEVTAAGDDRLDDRVVLGLASALRRDGELRTTFRDRFLTPRVAGMRRVFERAVERHEMDADKDLDMLGNVFHALVLQHLLTTGEAPDTAFMQRVMDEVVVPLSIGQSASN